MSSLPTAYTPLETLLLFQALRADGVPSLNIFNQISEQLKRIPLVCNDASYDPGRLSPDALRELYRHLLKEEARYELEQQQQQQVQAEAGAVANGGDTSPGSRKRKAASPSLPTVQEAAEQRHLLPKLVSRLYLRYRENAVREIREQERRCDALSRDIARLKAGDRDESLQRHSTAGATAVSDAAARAGPEAEQAVPAGLNGDAGSTSLVAPKNGQPRTQTTGAVSVPPPVVGRPSPIPTPNEAPKPPAAIADTNAQTPAPRPSQSPYPSHSPTAQSATSASQPLRPPFGPSQNHQQQRMPQYFHPGTTPPVPQATPNNRGPPSYGQSPVPHAGSPFQPQNQGAPFTPHQRPQAYPLPPQSGGQQLPPFPVEPQQRGRSPALQQPQQHQQQHQQQKQQQPIPHPHPPSAPPTAQRPAAQANPAFLSSIVNALATPVRAAATAAATASAAAGAGSAQQRKPVWKVEKMRHYTLVLPESPQPQPGAEPLSPVQTRAEVVGVPAAGRPMRSGRGKGMDGDVEVRGEGGEQAEEQAGEQAEEEPEQTEQSEQTEQTQLPQKPTRGRGRPRKREPTPQSATSPAESRVTRSHSVSTTAGVATVVDSVGRPESRGEAVKLEPSTPASFQDESADSKGEASAPATTAGAVTRKRAGTLQAENQQPRPKRSRRNQSPEEAGDDDEADDTATAVIPPNARATDATSPRHPPATAGRPNTITAYRNFSKLSSTLMNDINSHKHASYFVNAVRERDAPGYHEIIKHPQHLKSIRAAITSGTRAVTAAVNESPPNSSTTTTLNVPASDAVPSSSAVPPIDPTGNASSTVELERGEDLMPPKAIVNGAQLEKEVMRMLANAVMFNPGHDGMVRDTREMFEDVEGLIRSWRGLEREGGRFDGAVSRASVGDEGGLGEEEGKIGKRRKM